MYGLKQERTLPYKLKQGKEMKYLTLLLLAVSMTANAAVISIPYHGTDKLDKMLALVLLRNDSRVGRIISLQKHSTGCFYAKSLNKSEFTLIKVGDCK